MQRFQTVAGGLVLSRFEGMRAWNLRNQECTDKGVEDFSVWVSGAEDFRVWDTCRG